MKLSIWDILTVILLLAILLVGGLVMSVFANPYTAINPFPPQKLPPTVVIPSATATYPALPATWTPNADTQQAYLALGYTLVPSDTPGPSPTGFTLTFTDTPTETETPTETPTPTGAATQYVYNYPTSAPTSCSGCATSAPAATSTPNGINSATEIKGVKNNTWQKNVNNPVFLLPVTKGMFAFYYYWGLDPTGTMPVSSETPPGTGTPTDTPTSTSVVPPNYIPILHDAKSIDFTPPAVTDCGAYYLRISVLWAVKSGNTVTYTTSGWSTVFIFKYDITPPIPVYYAPSGIKGALRGIQNISGNPNFSWGNWNGGGDFVGSLIPSGDYRAYGPNSDGIDPDQIYQCSGVQKYQVYWGPDPNGTDPKYVHTTTSPNYDPSGVKSNTAYYLRINSIDQLGNASGWWTVALDDTYVYDPYNEPTDDQAAFYYDTVKPNNISSITETNYGYNNGDPFTNQNSPQFSFSGGDDPVGFKPGLYGYDVIWSTNPNNSTSAFQNSPNFDPLIGSSGTYYLRVRAVDWALNRSDWFPPFVYKFDNVGPYGVKKVSELTGAPNNAWTTTADSPSFSWNPAQVADPGNSTTSSGLVPGFNVYFDTDPSGTTFTFQVGSTFTPPGEPVSTGVYYLRIMVADNAGNQTITTPFILKFDNTPPDAPTIQVTYYKNNLNHPMFHWTSHDVGSGIASYYYYYGSNPPSGIPGKFSGTNSLDGKVHDSGTTYHLWVVAKDNAGNISAPATYDFLYP
ncbi:MAG TPA: hypothetical protein VKF38_08805 [Anaerolineaceae bacterium]|nr:hypothetical protein [Anaerolineaceae bacterium]